MFLLKRFHTLMAIAGSKYTTSAPDYSDASVADVLTVLLVLIAIIAALLHILSIGNKRRRK
jgi:hypothetical protein